MKEFLQVNGISILVALHVLFIGLGLIRFYEKREQKIKSALDEHEEKIS